MTPTETLTLTEFLLARIAEDEWWAHEASRRDNTYVDAGTRWRWVHVDDDSAADLDPARDPYIGGNTDHGYTVSLRSVEQFPTASVGPLPQFAISHAEEVTVPVAGHIARHDPARVLAECEAKRRIVADWGQFETYNGEDLMKVLALPYADHPDYRPEWAPNA